MKTQSRYAADASSYLFGSILSISAADLWILLALSVILTVFFLCFRRSLLVLIFDAAYGQAMKMPMETLYFALILMLAGSVLSMVKIIGAVLVEGLLILPAMTASLLASNYRKQLGLSFLFAALSLFLGLFLSATPLSLPPGAAVVASGFIFWVLALIFKRKGG